MVTCLINTTVTDRGLIMNATALIVIVIISILTMALADKLASKGV
jgi:hypothetical protein